VARTVHRAPWELKPRATLDKDTWELFDTRGDYSLATNVAEKNPAKLKEMQALFMKEAAKYNVLPIDDRGIERFNPTIAGRPDLMGTRTSIALYPGMTGMMENTLINVKNRSSTITAEVEIPQGGANGVLLAQGGRFGGWSLYLKDGKPTYLYNWVGLERYKVQAPEALAAGKATITLAFVYDGGGPGKGGMASLSVNGKKVAEGRVEKTIPFVISSDEGADVGEDDDSPVSEDYVAGIKSRFTGTISRITLDVK
jgi:arylsulfatase